MSIEEDLFSKRKLQVMEDMLNLAMMINGESINILAETMNDIHIMTHISQIDEWINESSIVGRIR